MQCNWRGVFPAAVTHFRPNQSLDIASTLKHLDQMIDAGIHGLVMLGSVGENCALETSEKMELLAAAVEHVAGRVPVLSGVAECSTHLACRFAEDAAGVGADGLMVLPVMVYKSDPEETVFHFRQVAGASDLPIMIYNNPPAYGVDIAPEMFVTMADEPKFVAIKESSNDPRRITDLINLTADRYALFCGVDDLVLESLLLGAVGWISGLVNAFPAENRALWDLAADGNWEAAREIYRWYTPLLHLDTHPKLVQYIKLAVSECGYGGEWTRSPRQALVGSERQRVLKIIRDSIASRPQLTQNAG